jgi:hypothetical protein
MDSLGSIIMATHVFDITLLVLLQLDLAMNICSIVVNVLFVRDNDNNYISLSNIDYFHPPQKQVKMTKKLTATTPLQRHTMHPSWYKNVLQPS